jgi:CBS domain-containing protein
LRRPEIRIPGIGLDPELPSQFSKSRGQYVEDVMTTKVASVLATAPLAAIADLLETMRLKRVPVTEHGEVVGGVSRADLLRALVGEVKSSGRWTVNKG